MPSLIRPARRDVTRRLLCRRCHYKWLLSTSLLHARRSKGKNPSFSELNKLVEMQLRTLKYDQTPCLLGSGEIIKQPIPMTLPTR